MTSVFISYSSKDVEIAETIQKCLEHEDFQVWRDERSIEADWSREIANALTECDMILLLWTKNASGSKYVKSEWMTARALGKVLKPIIFSKDKLNEELPDPIKHIHAIIDFKETNQIERNIQKLIESLENIDSFTCDYNYNILPTERHISYTSNKDFVGRDEDIVNIYLEIIGGLNKLHYQQVGLVGMPGVGKTQLATEFAYRYAYQFEKGIYWIQGADPTKWLQEIVNVAKHPELKLKIDKSDDEKENDIKYYLAFYNYCKDNGKEVLLIIDNVNEANSLYEQDILFPNDPTMNYNLLNLGCNILFTTRKNFDLSAEGVIQHPVEMLQESPSYELLTKYRKPASLREEEYARNICSRVGYLPLALVLAQAYLKRKTHVQFKVYDEELAKNRLYTIDRGKIKNEQLVTQHIAAVKVTFDEMWNILEAKDQDDVQTNHNAKKMFYLLSLFAESAIIPKARLAILSGIDMVRESPLIVPTEEAFHLLDELNLADILKDGNSVRIHPLLREYALERLQQQNTEYKEIDLKLESITHLKKAYYDDFSSLATEYAKRDGDIDSIIEDFRTALLWSEALSIVKANGLLNVLESNIQPIYQLNKVVEQEGHHLRSSTDDSFNYTEDKSIIFAQGVHIRSIGLNYTSIADKSRNFLSESRKPFLDLRWAKVRALEALIRTLEGHSHPVTSVAITSDNTKIVSGSYDRTIEVWDLNTGKLLNTLGGHSDRVSSLAITSDNRKIVSGSGDTTIRVWDLDTGKLLNTFGAAAFKYGTKWLQLRTSVKAIKSKIYRYRIKGHSSDVECVAVTYDDSKIVSGSWDKTIKIWDLDTGKLLNTLVLSSLVISVAVTYDNSKIVSGSYDGTIEVWDLNTGKLLNTLKGHSSHVESDRFNLSFKSVAITHDNNKIVSGSEDKTIKVWDLNTGKLLNTLVPSVLFPYSSVESVAVTSDNSKVISGSRDKTIRIWDMNTGELLNTLEGHSDTVESVAITSDNSKIVSGSHDSTIKVWDLNAGKLLLNTLEGHSSGVNSVAITYDNSKIVSGSWDKTIKVWDLNTGKLLNTLKGHSDMVESLAVTSDNNKIVGPEENSIKVWDLNTGKLLNTLKGHSRPVTSVTITSDNSKVISASWDKTIRVWDLNTGKLLLDNLQDHSPYVEDLAVTTDNNKIVGSEENSIKVWDLNTGKLLNTLKGHPDKVRSVTITSDNSKVISGFYDGTLNVWDLNSGKLLNTLEGHSGIVDSLAVTPDNNKIVSASWDKTIRVWDLITGKCYSRYEFDTPIISIALSKNRNLIIIGDVNGNLYAGTLFI